jgi:Ni/Co efflux regulator RcnB
VKSWREKPKNHTDMKKLLLLLAVVALAFSPLMVSQAQAAGNKTHKTHHQAKQHGKHHGEHHGKHHKKG